MGSRRLVRRATILPAVLALLVVGGGLAWATAGSAAPAYRTATVATGDVDQLLTVTGTAQNVDQTKVSFPVSGAVAAVETQVGATVTKGQRLAVLDTGPLQNAVVAATAALDKAKAALETDSTTAVASTGTSTSTSAGRTTAAPAPTASAAKTSATGGKTGTSSGATSATSAIAGSTALLALAQKALNAATAACGSAPATAAPTSSATDFATPTPSLTASPSDTASASTSSSPASTPGSRSSSSTGTGDCSAMLKAALDAQQQVARAQATAARALQTATTAAGSATTATAKPTTAPATGSTAAAGASTGSGGGQGAATGQSQAARITTDQAAVAAAEVALAVANKNLAGATLTSPVAGTIASQPFVIGASSGTSSIVIVVPGAVQVTVNVPATALPTLKVGQPATVTPDGSTTVLSGTVSAIGLLPTSSTTGSTTTYPVQVLVAKPGSAVVQGAAASVAITVKTVNSVLTVPNSALSDGAVMVLSQGKLVRTPVQTGAVGALTTEVTSGLQAGQQVALADLGAALPANSTTTTRGGGGNGGGFTGGPPGGAQVVRPGG